MFWILMLLGLPTTSARRRSPPDAQTTLAAARAGIAEAEAALVDAADPHQRVILLLTAAGHHITVGAALAEQDPVESTQQLELAIRYCGRVLREHPEDPLAELALFTLASALRDVGQRAEAAEHFIQLIRQFPEGEYRGEAYFEIGEHYFAKSNVFKALLAYKKSADIPDNPRHADALYKLAWCYYNVQEIGKAIETMKAVVAWHRKIPGHAAQVEAAMADLARFFADAGEAAEAVAWLTAQGREDLIRPTLELLAVRYEEQGRDEQSLMTWKHLIAQAPMAPEAARYQLAVVAIERRLMRPGELLAALELLGRVYGPGSSWARKNAGDPVVAQAELETEAAVRGAAVALHREARKRRDPSDYAAARQLYELWFSRFSASEEAYQMHYAYGELLYSLKAFEQAHAEYLAAVSLKPDGQHSRFCQESAIYAAQELVKAEGEVAWAGSWRQRELEAIEAFLRLWPDDRYALRYHYAAAYILHRADFPSQSIARFTAVIEQDPTSPLADQARWLVLDALQQQGDLPALIATSERFLMQGAGSDRTLQELETLHEGASFQLIAQTHEQGAAPAAEAESWLDFIARFPTSRHVPEALLSAAHAADRAAGESEQAAMLYERLSQTYPEHDDARDALYRAAVLRQARGEVDRALSDYRAFLTQWPDDDRAEAVTAAIQALQ